MSTQEKIKIVVINGSPKKEGHTSSLAEHFMVAAKVYADCQRIDLYDEPDQPVSGELGLPADNLNMIQKSLRECDAFVVVSPTYWFNMPGIVKNFIDHLTVFEDNNFLLEGKVAGCIVYTPEGGGEGILQNLALVFNHMGIVIPPYCLVFDRGDKADWVQKDISLMAHSIYQQVRAQQNNGFSWDY